MPNRNKMFLFDCDQTLWLSKDHDYISSIESDLVAVGVNKIQRSMDMKIFKLRKDVRECLDLLKSENAYIGIVSDNLPNPVVNTLQLLNIWQYITIEAFNVRLWNGYCPKEVMVTEIMTKKKFNGILPEDVFWIDDKDYNKQAKQVDVNFFQISPADNLIDLLDLKLVTKII